MLKQFTDELPLVAILRGVTTEEILPAAQSITQAGIQILEVTLNSPDAFSSIDKLTDCYGEDYLVGAGTVTSVKEIQEVKNIGGRIIISPHTDAELIRAAKLQNMIVMPGCFSPTEVITAFKAGADAVKLFPTEMIPPTAIKAIRAVLSPSQLVFAVGGINSHNMMDYLKVGTNGFGIGSSLYKSGKSPLDIAVDAKTIVSAFNKARASN